MRRAASCTIAIALLWAFQGERAQAQPARVFVAAQGSDGNPCTFALPCRTFQHAHDAVAAGGEIDVLDPAGYGAVIITKSISIQGHGLSGISTASGGTAVTINGGGSDNINLSGLLIEGAGAGLQGIKFNTGKSLIVQDCVIRGLTASGIAFTPTVTSALAVSSTLLANNGAYGALVQPSGGVNVTAVFNAVEAHNNALDGIGVLGTLTLGPLDATVTNS